MYIFKKKKKKSAYLMDTQRTIRLTWKFSRWIFHVGEGVQKWRFPIVRKPPGYCVIHGANAMSVAIVNASRWARARELFIFVNE